MLVYGDPAFQITVGEATRGLRRFAAAAERGGIAEARELLVACGQFEQGASDAGLEESRAIAVTDEAAGIFLARLRQKRPQFERLRASLQEGNFEGVLRVKIPEGCAFYCLYPEQYLRAAERWVEGRTRADVLVVGIRSIGTSLSALVVVTLRRLGWNARRVMVRPGGHPFQRTVEIGCGGEEPAIVVDEGPGLSGSSMASVVKALGRGDVTLFPSHAGEPGSAASEEVRRIWRETPRIVLPEIVGDLRDSGLFRKLSAASERWLRGGEIAGGECGGRRLEFRDLSAGQWWGSFGLPRRGKGGEGILADRFETGRTVEEESLLTSAATRECLVVPSFERSKFLFWSGERGGALWKFAGFGATEGFASITEQAVESQARLAAKGWTLAPVDAVDGFVATRWIEGRPMNAKDLTAEVLEQLATYILDAARPAVPPNSVERLVEMIRVNLGEEVRFDARSDLPGAGDGRLSPHEWILTPEGKILKTDVWGHEFDHTCVGPQSILWDIAGAVWTWKMDGRQTAAFVEEFRRRGLEITLRELMPHCKAWEAFEFGLRSMRGS